MTTTTSASRQLGSTHRRPVAPDPDREAALALLERAVRRNDPLLNSGALEAWTEAWEAGLRATLVAPTAVGRLHANTLARAVLRLNGHLTGPDITLRPRLAVAVGDQLVITSPGSHNLGPGTPAQVTAIHPAGGVVLDVPTVDGRAVVFPPYERLDYGYASPPFARNIELTPEPLREQGLSW